MDWKKNEDESSDKVLKALAVALNAEAGVDELFRRVVALEMKANDKKPEAKKSIKPVDDSQ